MTKSKLDQIHEQLDEIQKQFEAAQQKATTNKEACIALIHFVTRTLNGIAPGQVEAQWYGSYTNSGVANYPTLTINAYHRASGITLATWRINAGGAYPAPTITEDDITSAVLEGLRKISV